MTDYDSEKFPYLFIRLLQRLQQLGPFDARLNESALDLFDFVDGGRDDIGRGAELSGLGPPSGQIRRHQRQTRVVPTSGAVVVVDEVDLAAASASLLPTGWHRDPRQNVVDRRGIDHRHVEGRTSR